MDFKKVFAPNKRKLKIALILFIVLPTIIFDEKQTCGPWYSSYIDTEIECTTESQTIILPFFGLVWIGIILFDFSIAFSEMLGSALLHLIISYIIACLGIVFVLDKQKKTKGKTKKKA